ncbi:MAG: hypothetical protein E7318_13270 [Clostridiales bacterium]|nr:hypothetical protein [Clostridiales bacterium]
MKKYLKYLRGSFIGAACAALPVALSRVLIRNLAGIFGWIGSIASLDGETLSYGVQILAQLKSAVIGSPWLPFLLAGAVLGLLMAWITGRKPVKHIVIGLVLGLLLILLLTLLALWFTSINAISVGSLIESILPALAHLL